MTHRRPPFLGPLPGLHRQAAFAAGLALVLCRFATAADWTHWRGETRNGITAESSAWESGGWPPREAWRVTVGEGASSPLVEGQRVYVLGWSNGQDRLACLDARTGREL